MPCLLVEEPSKTDRQEPLSDKGAFINLLKISIDQIGMEISISISIHVINKEVVLEPPRDLAKALALPIIL